MSAKGRGTKPIANDAYPTPFWAVHRLLDVLPVRSWLPGQWLEPAAGSGAILNAVGDHESCMLIDTYPNWTTVDVRAVESSDRRAVHWAETDFLGRFDYPSTPFDVAITNPPFSLAFEFAKKMTSIARHSFLLTRLNILEAGKKSGRLRWLSENTPDVYVLPDRPCFSHTLRCTTRKRNGRYECGGVPIAWDAPTPARIECGCRLELEIHPPGTWPVELRTAGTDATGYCWLHWDSGKLPRTSGIITHLAETPRSERVDRRVDL